MSSTSGGSRLLWTGILYSVNASSMIAVGRLKTSIYLTTEVGSPKEDLFAAGVYHICRLGDNAGLSLKVHAWNVLHNGFDHGASVRPFSRAASILPYRASDLLLQHYTT